MQKFKLDNVRKLSRRNKNDLFLYMATGREINEWNIKKSNTLKYNFDGVLYITCSELIELNLKSDCISIEITDPLIISKINEEVLEDEYLVIINRQNLSTAILSIFLTDPKLGSLIESKDKRVSKNSLKVITLTSLNKLINNIFIKSNDMDPEILIVFFKEYITCFLDKNSYYFPSNVKEMVRIKERYVIHNINSWFIILRYFVDQLENGSLEIKVPLFSKDITYKNWSGNFFDRSNPLWEEIYINTKRPFYPSQQNQKKIYKFWKQLTDIS